MIINIIGLAPAVCGNGEPFEECASGIRLRRWLTQMGDYEYILLNLCKYKLPKNRLPEKEEIELFPEISLAVPTIALGNFTFKELDRQGFKFLHKMPHPSGRNRLLNQPGYEDSQVSIARVWLKQFNG